MPVLSDKTKRFVFNQVIAFTINYGYLSQRDELGFKFFY